jgi:polar amino acid transport system permease protein
MGRLRDFFLRLLLTLLVCGALVAILAASPYRWNFKALLEYRALYWNGLLLTIQASGIAFLVGMFLGVWIGIARGSRNLFVRQLATLYVEAIRGTPFLVQVSIAYFGIAVLINVNNKFWIGTLALGVFAAAYIGEIIRAGVESVDHGQREAARSLGLNRAQTMRAIILPQAVRRMIPPLTSELISLMKESSLLYTIGLMELMEAARRVGSATFRQFEAFLIVAGIYLSLTIPLSMVARRLETRLSKGQRRGAHL